MILGVISDTHDNLGGIKKAVEFFNDSEVEMVIHAGDFVSPFTVREFIHLKARMVGIFGNNDGDKILLTKNFREKMNVIIHDDPHFMDIEGKRVVITHKPSIVEPLSKAIDIIIYGHTHRPEVSRKGDHLIINPGECCGYLSGIKTVAIVDTKEMDAEIKELKDEKC